LRNVFIICLLDLIYLIRFRFNINNRYLYIKYAFVYNILFLIEVLHKRQKTPL